MGDLLKITRLVSRIVKIRNFKMLYFENDKRDGVLGGKKNYRIPVHYFILEAAISEEHMQVSGRVFCNSARFTTR